MQFINDPTPWTEGLDRHLFIVDLIANDSIPAVEAATLWWALERGASLFTAGGPSGAGKSTLANACLAFLPEQARAYVSTGRGDPFQIPGGDGPTYVLITELSTHGRPYYLSGPSAQRAFTLMRNGVRIIGTLHADSVDEAVGVLRDEIQIPDEDIARVTLVAITRVEAMGAFRGRIDRGDAQPRRRVVEIGLLTLEADKIRVFDVATWNTMLGKLATVDSPGGHAALARWAGLESEAVAAAVRVRAEALTKLVSADRRDPDEVKAVVRDFRERSFS